MSTSACESVHAQVSNSFAFASRQRLTCSRAGNPYQSCHVLPDEEGAQPFEATDDACGQPSTHDASMNASRSSATARSDSHSIQLRFCAMLCGLFESFISLSSNNLPECPHTTSPIRSTRGEAGIIQSTAISAVPQHAQPKGPRHNIVQAAPPPTPTQHNLPRSHSYNVPHHLAHNPNLHQHKPSPTTPLTHHPVPPGSMLLLKRCLCRRLSLHGGDSWS